MSEAVKSYRELKVWQKAMELVPMVYQLARAFPSEERYALSDQIRRAVVSMPANIAEGQARQSTKEFLHYLSIAQGSLAELETLLEVAVRLGYAKALEQQSLVSELESLRRMLYKLMQSLRQRLTTDH